MTLHDAARRDRVLDFITAHYRETGYPATVRDVMRAVGLSSTSAAWYHIEPLISEGKVIRREGRVGFLPAGWRHSA